MVTMTTSIPGVFGSVRDSWRRPTIAPPQMNIPETRMMLATPSDKATK